ncbi:disease resistance protein RGA2-like [Telopea speciosissima]|uniref:disease resistance protein RGA2-like n=1 Tax=Telopea speciosissima TaxID=54955 RepID=UPI001CC62F91|nr:disease resistance protein RGA2-like [Telopea speciosissima]
MEGSIEDIIVSLHVPVLLDKLSSKALRDLGSVWCAQSELRALSDVLGKIKKLLKFAEEAQARNILVKDCLRNLREVAYRAEDILDEFIYEACYEKDERYGGGKVRLHFPSILKADGLLRKQEIGPLINDELIKKLEEIEKEVKRYYVSESSGNQKSQHGGGVIDDILDTRPKSDSLVDKSLTLGRKEDVEAIKNKLLSSNPNENQKQVFVIAIVGLGGVGKTTLAQLVYNDPDVKEHFERRAWVCVSTDFNAVSLISAILESLNGRNPDLRNLDPLKCQLRKELGGKRVLIIIDDVWTEKKRDWEPLRVALMEAGEGSRIIVTTRSKRVSSMMQPMYTHDLVLSDEECWLIMERHISLNYGSIAPSLEEVGRKIARKCKRLPLAASTVAGYIFQKQRLIQLWSAEGFIRTDKAGAQYFDELLQRSFFQHYNGYMYRFVMHDLIHDLAEAVSGDVYGRFDYRKSSHSSKETRYSSMCCLNSIKDHLDHKKSYAEIRELPRGMKYLRNLQHLDLYGCRKLLSMPQGIGRLSSPKTLSIKNFGGWDERGDKDVEVLESLQPHPDQLRSLGIYKYSGLTFPRWLMIDLPSYNKLVTLELSVCNECQGLPPIGELPLLENLFLRDMKKLEEWSSSSCRGEESADEFPSLRNLYIEDCPELRILPQPLLSSPRLCELHFRRCPELWMLPTHAGGGLSRLTSLKNLCLGKKMEGLVQFLDETDNLPPYLNRLYIDDCKSLPKGLRNLSSLQHLILDPDCKAHYSPEELLINVIVKKGYYWEE